MLLHDVVTIARALKRARKSGKPTVADTIRAYDGEAIAGNAKAISSAADCRSMRWGLDSKGSTVTLRPAKGKEMLIVSSCKGIMIQRV